MSTVRKPVPAPVAEPSLPKALPGEPPISGVTEFQRRALALGFGVISLALFVLLVVIYSPVARPILWAAALGVLFFPVHRRILALVGGRPNLAAVISTLLTLALFAVPAGFFVTSFLAEAQNLWPSVRASLGPDTFERLAAWLAESRFRPLALWIFRDESKIGAEAIEAGLRDTVSGFSALAIRQLQEFGRDAPGKMLGAAITVLAYYFFLRHGPGWVRQIKATLPLEPQHADNLLKIAGGTVNAVFRGVIVTAAVQAILAGIGFAATGAPAPVVLGSITMLAALIPFVGPVAVWLPVAISLMVTGRMAAGIALFVWGALVVSLVDNFLRPYLIGRETKLPMLWLFLAILGGLRAFGFLGVLLGPAALALFLACVRIYTQGRPVGAVSGWKA
jgi:predicted PurR-regulated permease PerM